MSSSKTFALAAGVWALASNVAFAADMPLLERAPVIEEFGGWYLRGDVGITNQHTDRIYNRLMDTAVGYDVVENPKFDSGLLFGLGVGYQFNNWLRADLTGEYRASTPFHARDTYISGGNRFYDDYVADKTEWLFLANAYVDLGTWCGLTPYVGVGLGFAAVTIENYKDISLDASLASLAGGGYSPANTNWNFAWALHGGFGYQISPGLTLDVGYRYVNFGDVSTQDVLTLLNGANPTPDNPTTFKNLYSHDVKVALRWQLGGSDAPPVVRKY